MAALLALSVASTATAGSPAGGPERRAELDGQPIALTDVARHHCHNRDLPLIRCFADAAERDRDMVARSAELADATPFVTWYADANFVKPPSFTAYSSESDLSRYGWNDKISSFHVLNGGHPRWWQDAGNHGTWWDWGSVSISYVGDGANDKFSSVERL
jgi:hypothetical protein